jgi:hypothetical protein
MRYILLSISILVFNSFFIVLFIGKPSQDIKRVVNIKEKKYRTYENPIIDKFFFKHDINLQIEEQLLETCKTFKYSGTTNLITDNKIIGENERIGNCFDYAVHFVWNWNKKFYKEMPAFLIIYSNNDENSRGYYALYAVTENNTKYKGLFGSYDDFHYYSTDGKEIYYGAKFSDIKVPIKENHAWVIIMSEFYQIIVDPQETDHLGYSRSKFYINH